MREGRDRGGRRSRRRCSMCLLVAAAATVGARQTVSAFVLLNGGGSTRTVASRSAARLRRSRAPRASLAAPAASATRLFSTVARDGETAGGDSASTSAPSSTTRPTSRAEKRALAAVAAESGAWRTIDWDAVDLLGNVVGDAPNAVATDSIRSDDYDDSEYAVSSIDSLRPTLSPLHPSPVELVMVRDRMVYVKREDLLRLPSSNVSGNKARKVLALNQIPARDFPECVVSYGGPQSNSMLSLAAVVNAKNVELEEDTTAGGNTDGKEQEWGSTIEGFMGDMGGGGMSSEEAAVMLEEKDLDADVEEKEKVDDGVADTTIDEARTQTPQKRRFVYYTKKLPRYLRRQPSGNLLRALSLGTELIELPPAEYNVLFGGQHGGSSAPPAELVPPVRDGSVWIPQGGACGVAAPGVRLLAREVVRFWERQQRVRGAKAFEDYSAPLSVCIPGGTCGTGYLLHREMERIAEGRKRRNSELLSERGDGDVEGEMEGLFPELDIRVVVIPCVGDDAYAKRQMTSLAQATGGSGSSSPVSLPAVLKPLQDSNYGAARRKNKGYFSFGEPAAGLLQTFLEMRDEHGVFVDLLYGAPAWSLLLQHWKAITEGGVGSGHFGRNYVVDGGGEEVSEGGGRGPGPHPIAGRQIMYVHTGGLEGIASQMTRYKHKGLIDSSEAQG